MPKLNLVIIVPTKIVQCYVDCGMKTGEMHPGRANDKCPSPQNKMSFVGREVVGRSPSVPGTEKMLLRLELGQKWQWVGGSGGDTFSPRCRQGHVLQDLRGQDKRFYSTCN